MTDKKISALTELAEQPDRDGDPVAIVEDGTTKKVYPQYLDNPQVNLLKNTGFIGMSQADAVNGYGSAQWDDDMADDDTADYTQTGDSLTFDTDHYEFTAAAAFQTFLNTADFTSFKAGHLYRITLDIKDGTASSIALDFLLRTTGNGSTAQESLSIATTGAGWATVTWVVVGVGTERIIQIRSRTDQAGGNIEYRDLKVQEIVPSITGATALGPDLWGKQVGTDLYRTAGYGVVSQGGEFYAMHVVGTGITSQDLYYPLYALSITPQWYEKFIGRTVTMGAWVVTDGAAQAKLGISDGVALTQGDANVGTGFEWLTVTKTMSTAATAALFSISATNGDSAFMSEPMVALGSVCPAYVPPMDKWIPLDAVINSASYYAAGFSDLGAALNVHIDTLGKIGLGVEEILISNTARDAGSAAADCYMAVHGNGLSIESGALFACTGITNDQYIKQQGRTQLVRDLAYVTIDATGGTLFDAYMVYQGIKVK